MQEALSSKCEGISTKKPGCNYYCRIGWIGWKQISQRKTTFHDPCNSGFQEGKYWIMKDLFAYWFAKNCGPPEWMLYILGTCNYLIGVFPRMVGPQNGWFIYNWKFCKRMIWKYPSPHAWKQLYLKCPPTENSHLKNRARWHQLIWLENFRHLWWFDC